ncbi:HelD family protein [Luedemannella helvata]|uniref:HelD family protein n=1 Tax=Luedemannella helvata TaxID=349315 RepID=UPI0031E3B155
MQPIEPTPTGDGESTRQAEIAREQRHVDKVYARLETVRAEAERARTEGYALARARTPGSLVERDAMVYHAAQRLRALDAEYEGLVFGRLDLVDGEVRHVGRLGVRDDEHEPLVIDWRAPGAAPFYQATAEQPLGVARRRVIRSNGPTVLDVEDDLLDVAGAEAAGVSVTAVGDGALIASLARAKGTRMRDIVATIQREQDEAIRAPAGGVTIIEGGPGTGKTAVALHRAAHLLYRDRRRFEGGGVLLVGPSSVFMSYVERVLPSLGEETVELRALGAVLDGVRSERLDPPAVAAIKGALRMRAVLRRAVREAPADAPRELRVVFGGQVLRVRERELGAARRQVNGRVQRANAARQEVRRVLLDAAWAARPEGVSWDRGRFNEDVADSDAFADFARRWWPVRTPVDVLAALADPKRLARVGGRDLTPGEVSPLARSWANVRKDPSVADIALLDELRTMLGEPPAPPRKRDPYLLIDGVRELTSAADREFAQRERAARPDNYDGYAHVLLDEAQDVSPMQWRMLGRRGQYASWTIVGDAAQSAWPDLNEARVARDEALRGKRVRRFHLGTNYRNPAEIFEFAAPVVRRAVPDADLPVAVRRTGAVPEHRAVTDLPTAARAAVDELLAAVDGTVGVISTAARRREVEGWLRPDPRLQVVDGMQAKGMEYDAVLVVAPEELAAESAAGVRVLYVALTRATHRLTTIGADDSWLNG